MRHGARLLRVADQRLQEIALARTAAGERLATAFGRDRRASDDALVAHYLFADDRDRSFTLIEALVAEDFPNMPSVAAVLASANWYEREMRDLLGLMPIGHPDPRRLVLHEGYPTGHYPLRKDFVPPEWSPTAPPALKTPLVEGHGLMEVPVGPVHAGIIEPGHFRFSCIGDSVLLLDPQLFYTHKGTEKLCEGRTPDAALPLVQSLCGVCVASHAVGFAEAVERATGTAITFRARYLRTFLLELERFYNHVGDLGNICAGFGMQPAVQEGLHLKERCLRLNDRLTGHRFLRWAVAVGGLARDLENDAVSAAAGEACEILADLEEMAERVLAHDGAIDRMETLGILTREVADSIGCVGVAARASGIARDSRIDHPHAAYADFPPRIVTRSAGDVLARFQVRLEEARESVRLMGDIARRLPGGPVAVTVKPACETDWAVAAVESPRGEEIHFVSFDARGLIDRYHHRSASYVNWQAVPHTVPGNIVPDFPLINKSFELCYSCTDR